jgi:hypothetical protein
MSTFGTVLAYYLPMDDTIQVLLAGLLLHKQMRVGLRDVILCDMLGKVATMNWSMVLMYMNGRQMCALTFAGQRKCGAFGTVVPSAVVCVVAIVSATVLTTNICTVW